jgi:hypothetical protein
MESPEFSAQFFAPTLARWPPGTWPAPLGSLGSSAAPGGAMKKQANKMGFTKYHEVVKLMMEFLKYDSENVYIFNSFSQNIMKSCDSWKSSKEV